MDGNQNDDGGTAPLEVMDLEPAKKKNDSKVFLSRGWIVFLCVIIIFLVVLVAVLTVVLPKCKRYKYSLIVFELTLTNDRLQGLLFLCTWFTCTVCVS